MTVPAGVRLLAGMDGQAFAFDPGCFCLELLLTGGPAVEQRYEIWRGPADLVSWLEDSRLAALGPLEDVRVRPSELRLLKDFRDTMWSVARAVAAGRPPERGELELINRCTSISLRAELDPATGRRRWAQPVTGTQILGYAALDAVAVVGTNIDGAGRLRQCAAPSCSLLFLDSSRPGNRRWCAMQRCGNRNKVKAYRTRRETSPVRPAES